MMKLTRFFTLALFVSLTVFATGCGTGNSIQMTYLSSNLGGDYDCTKSVTVREFTDNRTTDWLGEKDDGHFSPSGLDVNEWVSQALFDELTEMGCTTNYHDGDFRTTTHYTISGSVNKAWVKEINIAEYEADFEISIVIYDNLKKKKCARTHLLLQRGTKRYPLQKQTPRSPHRSTPSSPPKNNRRLQTRQ